MSTVLMLMFSVPTSYATLVKLKRKPFVYSTTFFEIRYIYCLGLFQQIKSFAIAFCTADITIPFVDNDEITPNPAFEIF